MKDKCRPYLSIIMHLTLFNHFTLYPLPFTLYPSSFILKQMIPTLLYIPLVISLIIRYVKREIWPRID